MEWNFEEDIFPNVSMADWVYQQLKTFAAEKGKIAQIFADDGTSWTYEKLFQNSVHVAAGIESVGIESGDFVSFVTRNCHELYAIVLGCLMAGVTVIPSIAESPPDELRQNLLLVQPKFVIGGAPFLASIKEAISGSSSGLDPIPQIFEIKQFFEDVTANGALVNPATFRPAFTPDPKSHIYAMSFSSGTTGKQKAVAMTDYGMLRAMYWASRIFKAGERVINVSQFNWISWWFITIRSLFRGWERIFFDKVSTVTVLSAIHKFKPSVMFGPPVLVASMAHEVDVNPGRWDLSSLSAFFAGGDILNRLAHEEFSQKLKINIYEAYGSTESGVNILSRMDEPIVYGSTGKPIVPLKLVDLTSGEEIKQPNKTGEIVVKWLVMSHYYNNAEATATAVDKDGWFKTGDVAFYDDRGNYFIVDRMKAIFRYRGYQIAPSELEDIIMKIPGVKDVAVVGKPAGVEIGQVPTAFVVKEVGSNITGKDIELHLEKEELHYSKRLHGGVIFTDEIPRNVNGKIIRSKFPLLEISLPQSKV